MVSININYTLGPRLHHYYAAFYAFYPRAPQHRSSARHWLKKAQFWSKSRLPQLSSECWNLNVVIGCWYWYSSCRHYHHTGWRDTSIWDTEAAQRLDPFCLGPSLRPACGVVAALIKRCRGQGCCSVWRQLSPRDVPHLGSPRRVSRWWAAEAPPNMSWCGGARPGLASSWRPQSKSDLMILNWIPCTSTRPHSAAGWDLLRVDRHGRHNARGIRLFKYLRAPTVAGAGELAAVTGGELQNFAGRQKSNYTKISNFPFIGDCRCRHHRR